MAQPVQNQPQGMSNQSFIRHDDYSNLHWICFLFMQGFLNILDSCDNTVYENCGLLECMLLCFSAAQWMAPPQAPPNCPPGLEYLALVDQLLVQQKTELVEGMLCARYKVFFTVLSASIGLRSLVAFVAILLRHPKH